MPRSAVIVGAGPAGGLLAYILASRGVPVTLLERQSDFAREFRGEGMTPGGQQMFREAGLWDAFDALPHATINRAELFFKRRPLTTVQLKGTVDFVPRFVSQPAMLEMLVDKASAFPCFTFRRGVRVAGPVMRDGRVVGIELAGDGGGRIDADYVFACDGRFSAMRKAAGLDQPHSPQFFDVVWCKIPLPDFYADEPQRARGYAGNGHLGLFFPSYDGMLQIGWIIRKGAYKEFREHGIEHWLSEMAAHVSPDMAAHLRAHAGDTIHPFLLDVICDTYDEWSVPGMVLLGDAAHPMSPVGAQGINLALRDAVVCANHFTPLLLAGAEPAAFDAAAEAFHAERLKEVAKIQTEQRRAPMIMFSRSPWLDVLMWTLRALSSAGLIQWLVTRIGFRKGAFITGTTEVTLKV